MNEAIRTFLEVVRANRGINDKARLAKLVCERCNLTRDRSVFYCEDFAVRFSASASRNFGNTVLSLSNLRKYERKAFLRVPRHTSRELLLTGEYYVPQEDQPYLASIARE